MDLMEQEIDDSLYSRQRYLLGDVAMKQMAKANILLFGIGGLGIEIAKNIILAGIKSLTVADAKSATINDLGTQFFLSEEDVRSGKNRAEACVKQLSELNPYVTVRTLNLSLTPDIDLSFLSEYNCVILTETNLSMASRVNDYCRAQKPVIKFLYGDVKGVFCWAFCDFGDNFEVCDTTGEEPKEVFVGQITKGSPGVVTTLEGRRHGLEQADIVTFKEVKGMTQLNGSLCRVSKVLSPYSFEISDTASFDDYEGGGMFVSVKTTKTFSFNSLSQQLASPSLLMSDFSKLTAPANIHLGLLALDQFVIQNSRLPTFRDECDHMAFLHIAKELNEKHLTDKLETVDENLLRCLSLTCEGQFTPLCAFLGGILAQEAIISVTGKFSPLHQWLCLDASEVVASNIDQIRDDFVPRGDRFDALRICVGHTICDALSHLKLFMVGCGAIGCELLKNFVLLGIGTSARGLMTITDNDLIEKSNLNRQFLFRSHHIRQPKSAVAAESARVINSATRIEALQHKVCPETETSVFTDEFFESQDIIVNALDNVEARRYMDSRCVTNQRPLLESGTMGAKGHVQVIVPMLTESYSSQRDPVDGEDIPFCTLKSFPANMEHCIQWARDKFESMFSHKPSLYNKFWNTQASKEQIIQSLEKGDNIDGTVIVSKCLLRRPQSWRDCIELARLKLEKYFHHRALQLLHNFPLDTKNKDGSLFWQSPKRPPVPIAFDPDNAVHFSFIISCARLFADMYKVNWSEEDKQVSRVKEFLSTVVVPTFKPASKVIETDETKKKEDNSHMTHDAFQDARSSLVRIVSNSRDVPLTLNVQSFEKDDDHNDHINFIAAASNLRAEMYSIPSADRLAVKKIAGRIVPAIATTTAAVAGLVCVELIKLLQRVPLSHYKNCFLSLALPAIVFSEPGRAPATTMSSGISFTQWDRWEVKGHNDLTLAQFLQQLQDHYKVKMPTAVVQGAKMVYIGAMPGHNKRLSQLMIRLIKIPSDRSYVDLVVSYSAATENSEDEAGPIVRYYFK